MLNHASRIYQENRSQRAAKLMSLVVKCIPTLLVIGILGLGWFAVHEINSESSPKETEISCAASNIDSGIVRLPVGKLETGQFHCVPVEEQLIQHRHDVPGRIQYDESRHIAVKAAMDGVLSELLVKPGDRIENRQLLAVIKSPEIGQARSEVLRRQQQLQIVQQKLTRERELSKNLYDFFDQLDQGKTGSEIDELFVNRSLGNFRQELLSAYSQLSLARSLIEKGKGLGDTGAISGRIVRERESELAMATAAFRTIRDQSAFASKQAKLQAEADVADAQRQSDIAQQTLESLLGYPDNANMVESTDALSRLEIHAPFAGTVESRLSSQGERISKNDSLIVLADTGSLYVAADIREADWTAVAVTPGTQLTVTVPALENRELCASVHYIGREVMADTNAIPIIALIDNAAEWLRPGMFVRVSIPVGKPSKSLAVKPSSIVQHDERQFVFVKIGEGTFKRVDIVTGLTSNEWIEVTEGLSLGELVVDQGAFLLKSELLLEGESE